MKIIETCFNNNIFLKEQNINDVSNKKDSSSNNSDCKENIIPNITGSIEIGEAINNSNFVGFGGAITEAAGYAYAKLSNENQEKFLNDYKNYNIIRISIGSCDFSLNSYSYSKKNDLSDFSIERDKQYIIPLIKDLQKVNPNIRFLATPWSPPSFMKHFHQLYFGTKLKKKYFKLYAQYIANFILAYQAEGINISYMTVQNETTARQIWESCLFSPEEEADFAINYLHPTLQENNLDIKILIHDHNKDNVYERSSKIFELDKDNIISGIAIHWYTGDYFENVLKCYNDFKNKLIFHTEGCVGFSNYKPEDEIINANMYAHDIIGDLSTGVTAYIDWNILLDNNGGPNHKNNFCNAPSMIRNENYYNNLCYYYIQHFAKYIHPNASLVSIQNNSNIEAICFKNEDNSIVVVLLNMQDYDINIKLKSNTILVKKQSIITVVL